jgi:hypothetical protein
MARPDWPRRCAPSSHGTGAAGPLGTSTLVARVYRSIDLNYRSLFATGKAVRYEGGLVTEEDFRGLLEVDCAAVAA